MVKKDYIFRGTFFETGYLTAVPQSVRATAFTDAILRFTAGESGFYNANIEVKAAELGYGGTQCRVLISGSKVIATHNIPKLYGAHWEFTKRIYLHSRDTLSLAIGPSANGDNASDTTLMRFEVQPLSTWESIGHVASSFDSWGAVLLLAMVASLAARFWVKRRGMPKAV